MMGRFGWFLRRRDVVSIVLVQTLGLAIAGLALGLGAALAFCPSP